MLVIENDSQLRDFLPGLIPENYPSEVPFSELPGVSSFDRNLGVVLVGETPQCVPGYSAPADWRGDFWTSWYLAGKAESSQYDVLRQVISDSRDLPGHVVCLALRGKGFHGQNQRGWLAELGNIHLTLGLRCDLAAADCGLALTMLPAVAVVDALRILGIPPKLDHSVGVKWVNDILVDGKKLGGVLTSARSQDGRLKSAVLGIGLNIAVAPRVAPTIFTPQVTCLDDHISLGDKGMSKVLAALLGAVAARFEQLQSTGPGPLLGAYRRVPWSWAARWRSTMARGTRKPFAGAGSSKSDLTCRSF